VRRAQSHVVGIVLLLGITTIALGGLTTVVGSVVDGQTERADGARVATTLAEELRPIEGSGPDELLLRFSEGRLRTVDRQLRVRSGGTTEREVEIDGFVYTSGSSRVGFVGGAVVRGQPGNAWLVRSPPVTVTRDNSTLVVGAVRLNESGTVLDGTGGVTATVRSNVTHNHESLSREDYRITIETATPEPLARELEARGASTTVTDIDGDGVPSVVMDVNGQQRLELVVHDMRTEVNSG